MKGKIDEILAKKDELTPSGVTDALFGMLADFMTEELMGIEKIDFELSVLAMNDPGRVDKIMKGMPGVGNMEYLTMRTMEYFVEETKEGTSIQEWAWKNCLRLFHQPIPAFGRYAL